MGSVVGWVESGARLESTTQICQRVRRTARRDAPKTYKGGRILATLRYLRAYLPLFAICSRSW